MKKGLVMEGGGMRGMFVAGVCDVLMENNIVFDGAIGVSAGACFGCNYKSGQIGRAIRCTSKYITDPRYCSFGTLLKTGNLFGPDFCYHQIPEKLDVFDSEAFKNNPMEFYVVCSDAVRGNAIYRKCEVADYETMEWIRASASLPLVSKPVEIKGLKLLDGGIIDSIPLKWFCANGYNRNIVVLTQPKNYRKKKSSTLPLLKVSLLKYPKMFEAVKNRHIMYNKTLDFIEEKRIKGEALVIQPDNVLPVERLDKNPENLRKAYYVGREITERRIDEIKKFINQD